VRPEELEEQFRDLKARAQEGAISDEEFEAQLREFLFRDDSGTYWTLGAQTEKWYRHQDGDWVQAEPPATLERSTEQEEESRVEPPVPSPPAKSRLPVRAVVGGAAVLLLVCLVVVAVVSFQYGLMSSLPGAGAESPTPMPTLAETPWPQVTPSPRPGGITGSPTAEQTPSIVTTVTQQVPVATPRPSATATPSPSSTPVPVPTLRHAAPRLLLPEDGAERAGAYKAVLVWETVDNLDDDEYYHVEVCWNECTMYEAAYTRETTWIFPEFLRGASIDDWYYWHVTVRQQVGDLPDGPNDPITSPQSQTWSFLFPD
jgi:hypothetical protein